MNAILKVVHHSDNQIHPSDDRRDERGNEGNECYEQKSQLAWSSKNHGTISN